MPLEVAERTPLVSDHLKEPRVGIGELADTVSKEVPGDYLMPSI
jgi:hypothetical protein